MVVELVVVIPKYPAKKYDPATMDRITIPTVINTMLMFAIANRLCFIF
jgi:hypothetical protein